MASADSTVDALLSVIPVAATVAVAGSAFKAFDRKKKKKKVKNGFW